MSQYFKDSARDKLNTYSGKTQFDESLVARKKIVLNYQSSYGINSVLDYTSSVADSVAQLNADTGEILLSTSADTTSYIQLQTSRRGRYVPGNEAQCSIGIRTGLPVTNHIVRWGYYDEDDGYGYQLDSNGFRLFYKQTGSYTYINQSEFNYDILDGTGPSGLSYNSLSGSIYAVNFAWYGYGDAFWKILKTRDSVKAVNPLPSIQIIHAESSGHSTRISNPNLPITVEVDNNGADQGIEVYVGGRQYSIYGEFDLANTEIVDTVEQYQLTSSADVWEPLFAIKRNPNFPGNPNIILREVDISTDQPIYIKTTIHNTSGSAEFFNPTSRTDNTSAVLVSKTGSLSGSTLSGDLNGIQIPPFISADSGRNNNSVISEEGRVALPRERIFLIWGKYTSAAPTITLAVDWEEDR